MEHSVTVNVLKDNKSEEEVEVYFETDDFDELADKDKKVAFIKEQARNQYEDIKKVYFNRIDLRELQKELDDINSTSGLYNDETYNEFMEHDDFF